MKFPGPHKIGAATRWRLSDLERAEAEACGEPGTVIRTAERELYLSVKQVAARYSVSVPTVWRWSSNTEKKSDIA